MAKFKEVSPGHFMFDCPGCKMSHEINTMPDINEPVWSFNGNLDKPTVTPSILCRWTYGEDEVKKVCHSFVTDGNIQFLSDCTHSLACDIVEIPEFE